MPDRIATVPNQRVLTIHKEPTDKDHKYSLNNLAALDEAAFNLQKKASFKLYMYLAKNQDKYNFALSSSHFMAWAGVAKTAYDSAFEELEEKGYLVPKEPESTVYTFYDKSQKLLQQDNQVTIEVPKAKVEEVTAAMQGFNF